MLKPSDVMPSTRVFVAAFAIGCLASTAASAQTQTLKVTLLGTGSPRPLLTRFGPPSSSRPAPTSC